MACAVDVGGWPQARRSERDVATHFGDVGDVRSVSIAAGRESIRVLFANEGAAVRAVRLLNGSRPAGFERPLTVRAARPPCPGCAALRTDLEACRARLETCQNRLANQRERERERTASPPPRSDSGRPPRRRDEVSDAIDEKTKDTVWQRLRAPSSATPVVGLEEASQ